MKYINGNLLDATSGIIVHGCNAQGVMGSGVAKAVKDKYPEAYQKYYAEYLHGLLTPGWISVYNPSRYLTIVSGITQEYYGRDKNVVYVDYDSLAEVFRKVKSIWPGVPVHIPKIGAGLANGDWEIISRIINTIYTDDSVTCYIF